MALQVIEQIAQRAREWPDAEAVVMVAPSCSVQQRMSYRDLHQQAVMAASRLRADHAPGDVVILCSPNQPSFVVAFLAALMADLTVFPVHPGLTQHELREAARRSNAQTLIGSANKLALVEGLGIRRLEINGIASGHEPTRDERMAHDRAESIRGGLMLQTTGTTGIPKIVYRSGRALDAVARNVVDATHLKPDDRVLAAMPLCHSYGVENGLLGPLLAGAAIHPSDGFDPASIARHLSAAGITVFPGVPFMHQILAERSAEIAMPTLRLAYSAGSALPVPVAEGFRARFGISVEQLYGSTEIGSVTFGTVGVGRPMRDVRVQILDADEPLIGRPLPCGSEGLVAVSAPSMLDRYVGDDTPALVDGYFFTGDLGRMDEDGNLIISGRVKLQIDVGGMKVNPLEVEQILAQHPAVRECIVIPEPVTHTVSRLKAVVALHELGGNQPAEELRQFVRERLASYKVPRLIEFRDSLPKSPTGKVLREALRCG